MSEPPSEPAAVAPSEDKGYSSLLPQAKLADKIAADWQWVVGAYASYQQSTAIRDNCISVRKTVQSWVEAVRDAQARAELSVTQLVEPSPEALSYKQKAMEIRRNYKAPIVAAIAALSVLPAVRAGPSKLEKLRVALRNLVCIGGGTTFLFYRNNAMNPCANSIPHHGSYFLLESRCHS